jgi:hypothetical protein
MERKKEKNEILKRMGGGGKGQRGKGYKSRKMQNQKSCG